MIYFSASFHAVSLLLLVTQLLLLPPQLLALPGHALGLLAAFLREPRRPHSEPKRSTNYTPLNFSRKIQSNIHWFDWFFWATAPALYGPALFQSSPSPGAPSPDSASPSPVSAAPAAGSPVLLAPALYGRARAVHVRQFLDAFRRKTKKSHFLMRKAIKLICKFE